MNPFTARVTSLLPNQVHKKAIVVDSHLRVLGAPKGEVYAIGDCSTVGVVQLDLDNKDLHRHSDRNVPFESLLGTGRRV
jgi:hypothetical protein